MNLSNSTRWILSATLVMAAALGIGRFAYTPLLPAMVTQFDWSFATAGDVASANYLGYMVGAHHRLAPGAPVDCSQPNGQRHHHFSWR